MKMVLSWGGQWLPIDLHFKMKNSEAAFDALKEVSEAWRGSSDIYLNPLQKEALRKVNEALITLNKEIESA